MFLTLYPVVAEITDVIVCAGPYNQVVDVTSATITGTAVVCEEAFIPDGASFQSQIAVFGVTAYRISYFV